MLEELDSSLLSIDELENMLRACILKIQVSDSILGRLPEGSRFEMLAYSHAHEQEGSYVWVDEDRGGRRVQIDNPRVVPIKSMESSFLRMQLVAEVPRLNHDGEDGGRAPPGP